jgi:hypothetical protein
MDKYKNARLAEPGAKTIDIIKRRDHHSTTRHRYIALRPSADYHRAHAALYGQQPQSRFRRDWLPDAQGYYRRHLQALHVRGDWADARCPFHADVHASLSVNLIHGGYLCHACGARGGDVLDFHRRLHGMGFVAAAQDLGAWEVDQ